MSKDVISKFSLQLNLQLPRCGTEGPCALLDFGWYANFASSTFRYDSIRQNSIIVMNSVFKFVVDDSDLSVQRGLIWAVQRRRRHTREVRVSIVGGVLLFVMLQMARGNII